MKDDLRITQLLCSRLCHDLVGPVGAINNGIELIEDAPDMLDESLALLSNSAKQASRRLAFYRIAFGFGGGASANTNSGSFKEARRLAQDFLAEGNVTLDWPESTGEGGALPKNAAKLLMNMVLLGVAALPRGGSLKVGLTAQSDALEISVTAQGQGAGLREDIQAAIAPGFSTNDLTAHNVQSQFATRLALSVGAAIKVSQNSSDEIKLAVSVPFENG